MLDSLQALELRVLQGPQAGARAPLAAGRAVVVSAGGPADADIVLRDDSASARLRITADIAHALVEVIEGELRLGEQLLAAGAHAAWARHEPLRIGATVLAFGLACEDEWPEAQALPDAAAAAAAVPADAGAQKTRPPLRRRAEAWLAATGAAVLLACGGSLWMAHVAAAPVPPVVFSTPLLAEALKAGEFSALEAATLPGGRPVLRGRLADLAQRARLETWLATRQWTPALDLLVDELVARDVAEVFRVNGIAAQAKATGAGRFAVELAERDTQRLARAEEVVRRDVRGLQQLSLRNTATPLPPPAVPVVDDPNKRIASLVPGEPAYVVTADGARYFVGALLPSGHRIAQIAAQRVVLERDGRQTNLNF
jgi:type III secretion protein D